MMPMVPNRSFCVKLALAAALLCFFYLVAQGREASSVGGFSLTMSKDQIASIARTRLGLKVVYSDESLDLYERGSDPDEAVPLAYFSYGKSGEIDCMHFQIRIFKVDNIFTKDLLRILQALYGVERFRRRKLRGYPVFFHGHTKFGEQVSILSSSKTKPSWINLCSTDQGE
jgi:hypothetical protein